MVSESLKSLSSLYITSCGRVRHRQGALYRFRHAFATWAIEQQAREIDVQRLLGHSTSAMLRRYTASYDAEKAAQAHASFSPGDCLATLPAA